MLQPGGPGTSAPTPRASHSLEAGLAAFLLPGKPPVWKPRCTPNWCGSAGFSSRGFSFPPTPTSRVEAAPGTTCPGLRVPHASLTYVHLYTQSKVSSLLAGVLYFQNTVYRMQLQKEQRTQLDVDEDSSVWPGPSQADLEHTSPNTPHSARDLGVLPQQGHPSQAA